MTIGRVMALDYGERRIGIALTDPMRIIASPHDVLFRRNLASDLEALAAIIDDKQVVDLVVGQPNNADGSSGEMVDRVEAFVQQLLRVRDLPVHWVDETYTSLEADELLREESRDWRERKARVDKVAAQLILRSWLDTQG